MKYSRHKTNLRINTTNMNGKTIESLLKRELSKRGIKIEKDYQEVKIKPISLRRILMNFGVPSIGNPDYALRKNFTFKDLVEYVKGNKDYIPELIGETAMAEQNYFAGLVY